MRLYTILDAIGTKLQAIEDKFSVESVLSGIALTKVAASGSGTVTLVSAHRTGDMMTLGMRVDAPSAVTGGTNLLQVSVSGLPSVHGEGCGVGYSTNSLAVAIKDYNSDIVTVRAINDVAAGAYFTIYISFMVSAASESQETTTGTDLVD